MGIDGISLIKDGWFMEKGTLWPGQAMSLQVESVLHHSQSALQDILVFRSTTYGNVLVLDGVIQLTERDEFSYHEPLAHIPLYAHGAARDVLVIGGGDGGAVREILRHDTVRSLVLCEIDPVVTETSRRFFADVAVALDDARVSIVNGDGAAYVAKHRDMFDVIIADTSDPIGPANVLFDRGFYSGMHGALRAGGVLCTQGESIWLHADIIAPLIADCRAIFPVVQYAWTLIPTYPCGQIGFVLCSKDREMDLSELRSMPTEEVQQTLRYYNAEVHKAAFVLPQFAKKIVGC